MPGPDVEERKMSVQNPHSVLPGPEIRLTQAIPMSPSSQSIFLTMNNLETIRIPTNTLANVKKTSVTANTASPLLMVDCSGSAAWPGVVCSWVWSWRPHGAVRLV
jgi:hypothetical protein